MKLLLLLVLAASAASAQGICTEMVKNPRTGLPDCIRGTSASAGGGFASLTSNNTLLGRQDATGATSTAPVKTGTTLPISGSVGDMFLKTDEAPGQELFIYGASGWTQASSSGGGSSGSVFAGSRVTAIAYASSLTFNLADVSSRSPVRFEVGTLTGNVTSIAFANKAAGQKFSIVWKQGSPARTVDYGSSVDGVCPVAPIGNATTTQLFEVAADGATVLGVGCSTDAQGVLAIGPTSGACGAPPLGYLCSWLDAADNTVKVIDHSGNIYAMPKTDSGPTANQFVDYIAQTGIPHKRRPTAADVSNAFDLTSSNDVTNIAEPGSPAGGKVRLWTDTTSTVLYAKNSSGAKTHTVQSKDCSSVGHVAKINADGTVDCSSDAGSTALGTAGEGAMPLFSWCDYCQVAPGLTDHDGFVWQFVSRNNISVKKIGIVNGGAVAAYGTIGIYSDSAGVCDTLLGQATPQSLNVSAGTNLYFSFATAVPLVVGRTYWFVLTTDTFGGFSYYGQGSGITPAILLNEPGHDRAGKISTAATGSGSGLSLSSSCGSILTGGVAALPLAVAFPGA